MIKPEEQLRILKRNVEELISEEELLERLKTGRPLRVKLGVDPSRPDLHLGHAVVLKKLREFQDLGHIVVLIIGDFTARIGDPSGRSKTRPMLSAEEAKKNAVSYQEQAFKILDRSKTELRFNSEWLEPLNFEDVIRLAAKYTVARMLERDDFEKRYKNGEPISIAEFLYPIAQAYDSVAVKSDVEMGGTDQKFNLLVGRKYQEEFGQKPQIVMTMPLIEGTDGNLKMSKSYNNYVAITDTPQDVYGKIMSIPDSLMFKYAKLLTDLDVEKAEKDVKSEKLHPMEFKKRLAFEITKWLHDEESAKKAEEYFVSTFSKKETPKEIKEVEAKNGVKLSQFLKEIGATSSSSEAKRLIKQGGVKIDNTPVKDPFFVTNFKGGEIIRVGKLKFYKIKIS
ncbi:tyrosine--tRNA ligase [Mesoaciditoga lauensis]|uniref:tyrosine--tRNA ligase n=1 Tax=Mesoaciditoga lauensis TaxID=1495039 RepID=UPI000B2AE689|nr:tyrosine--tRNA ligase [Mesoaciditoga lauensis]